MAAHGVSSRRCVILIAIGSKADILRVCRGRTLSRFRQAIARLSRQRFPFWEWPVFSAIEFLRLGLDHLVQPAGNKDGHVLLRPGIFSIGRLEKFLSPSPRESDSVSARGHGRMERASHGAERLFRY